jgi:predicted RNA methylase
MSKSLKQISLAKALKFRIGDNGLLYGSISHSSGEFYIAPEILSMLCYISSKDKLVDTKLMTKDLKTQYESLLKNLPNEKENEEIIQDLLASGFLNSKDSSISRYMQSDGFGDPWIQWAMLSDKKRCLSYKEAIEQIINKDSIVADVGAGTGLLSALSLKAGAKKVIAIEETQTAKVIEPFLKELKLKTTKDKLEIINQNSFDVALSEKISVVVSELFGNDPFQEGVIHTLRNFALQLKTKPTFIPKSISVYFELIELKEHPTKHRIETFYKQIDDENLSYLSAAKKLLNLNNISFPMALSKSNFKRVSHSIELGKLPLNPPLKYKNIETHPLTGKKKIKVTDDGKCIIGLIWYRVYLTDKITISSHCLEKDAAEHWSPIALLLSENIKKDKLIQITHNLNDEESRMEVKLQTSHF